MRENTFGRFNDSGDKVVKRKGRSPEQQLWYEASRRALRDGLLFTLKPEDVKIPQFCPALGIPLFRMHGTGLPGPNSPTLDRVDNTQGYTRRNVRVISYRANMLKKDGTADELEQIARYIRAFAPISSYDSTCEERGVYPTAV